ITPIPPPASSTARGLNFPIKPATVEGSPKTPLPITELTTSAVRLQRPIARTSCWLRWRDGAVSGIAWFYHKRPRLRQLRPLSPRILLGYGDFRPRARALTV